MAAGNLQGKKIFITGASGGIGAEIARLCGERGAKLALFARRMDKLENLKKEINGDVYIHQLDVSDTDEVKQTFTLALKELGGIDILVNNAGFGVFRKAHEATIDEIKRMFDVNVIGLMACTSIVLPVMKEQRRGHIINIASQAGKIATPKSSVYSATKHAVLGYSNSLRMELADDCVYVTTVNPGPIDTDFFKIADTEGKYVKNVKRFMLKPEYVAKKIVDGMISPKREINLPRWMNGGSVLFALFPGLFEKVARGILNKK